MSLRIPAGVRIDGLGVGGRFVSLDMLLVLVDATDDNGRVLLLDLAARELERATDAQERLERKFHDDPARFAEQRANAEGLREFWETFMDESASVLVGPSSSEVDYTSVGMSDEYDEDVSDEWEIGLDYNATKGAASDVDLNIRLRRMDGKPFGFTEASQAMSALRANLSRGASHVAPSGYRVAAINWKRPHTSRGWTFGTAADYDAFQAVFYIAADDDTAWRLGSVE